ncbi:tetratricopeptide repeat protein [Occallatibacter savannae]|uniref:tetratricopeptide repeat protein n=1 Tax=Occallatibacter savannae TaxID=1002691 RepID=UPI001EF52265|nr:tetratricopeptide repeat protein [Occallatibacter savannae]
MPSHVKQLQGVLSEMFKFSPRRLAAMCCLVVSPLTVSFVVRASSDPVSSAPAATAPDAPPAAYTASIRVSGPTSQFHDSVTSRYNYAFGKEHPFLPSNAMTANGQFVNPRAVPTAEYCGHCHQEAYHQWRQSVHSNSFRQPWYLKNVNMLIGEKGVQFSRHCEGCHNPIALFSGDLSQGMPKTRPFEDEGVSCAVCHSIQSTDTTGTGSYVMATPAVLVDEKGAPVTRQVSDAEILGHLDRHKQAVMRPLLKTSEFCAACHKATIPRALDDYKFLRAFTVYDEWQGASFTKQSPLPFYRKDSVSTCQTCHMAREQMTNGAKDAGAKDGTLVSHRWLGGNSLNAAYYKFDEQAEKLVAFLKNGPDGKGVLNVDIFALEKESAPGPADEVPTTSMVAAPLGLKDFSLSPGDTLIADVVIQNKGIGHSFIPEQRDFYEAWVDFNVKDSAGKMLAESGFIKPDGDLDPSAHSFTSRLVNTEGTLNDIHQIWHNRVLAYNNGLQSGRSQLVRYRFRLPKTISGPVTITASVRYRRFDQHFLDFAMDQPAGKHYSEPVLEVASTKRTLAIGDNPTAAPMPGENPEWMRWNNYGIALLDSLQYEKSVEAFKQVATLRPDYADAYTNMAVVETVWERYNDAKPHLAKALELLPGDPRALYYRAIVERNAGQIQEAIEDLKAMLAKYPRAKDGLRELGFSYYQAHDYPNAREQYEKLQAIDPDDLAAHYQLAILYRRLGEKDKAAVESAKFADQKDDPTASTYALMFLRKHPEVASESVTWHTHDLTGDPVKAPAKIEYKYIPGAGM